MGIILMILVFLGIGVIFSVDLNIIFNTSSDIISKKTLLLSVLILFFGTMSSFYLNIINSIMHTMQKSGLTGLFALATNIIILSCMLVFDFGNSESNFLFLSA
ncbi:MAG: hypothetical protein PHP65_06010, partial [Bacilli bacterium]|nr:hypothetical protein [Bacilli bacterium]